MKKFEAGKDEQHTSQNETQYERRSRLVREAYAANPKICPTCNEKLPFAKRRNTFCGQSCSATHNNRGKVRVEVTNPAECDHCGAIKEKRHNKYCDACIVANVYSNKLYSTTEAKTDLTRRRILLESRGHQCESCHLTEWLNQPIPLELDHIDGDPDNNVESNLRLICPNCHALTDNYKGANSGNSTRQKMRRKRYEQGKTY